jgi:hypothetical protein
VAQSIQKDIEGKITLGFELCEDFKAHQQNKFKGMSFDAWTRSDNIQSYLFFSLSNQIGILSIFITLARYSFFLRGVGVVTAVKFCKSSKPLKSI